MDEGAYETKEKIGNYSKEKDSSGVEDKTKQQKVLLVINFYDNPSSIVHVLISLNHSRIMKNGLTKRMALIVLWRKRGHKAIKKILG